VETKREALILKVSGTSVEGTIDEVASELPVRLILNNEQLVTLLCTPSELEESRWGSSCRRPAAAPIRDQKDGDH